MKKILLMLVAMVLAATQVWAKGPQGVSATIHNLSLDGSYYESSNEDEVCIFCHTPHGGSLNGPLWNRIGPDMSGTVPGLNTYFTHYTSTTLLSGVDWTQTTRAVSTESMLCMSCHDGQVAMNSIINSSNRTVGGLPDNSGNIVSFEWVGDIGKAIGEAPDFDPTRRNRDLTDDHPISFSYSAVSTFGSNSSKLKATATAESNGVRFFGAGKRVECSTCHDPHVNYTATGNPAYSPFLITPNSGSALCLACHIK